METYAIRRDGYDYQELDLEIDDFIEIFPEEINYNTIHDFSMENLALAQYWKPVSTGFSEIHGEKNLSPDICNWIGATLVLSPKAYRFLKETLNPFGEFLPVLIDNDTYYIFNCLTVVNGDSSASHFSFSTESIRDKLIFKSTEQHCIDIYCTDRLKDAIESFGLRGVMFDRL